MSSRSKWSSSTAFDFWWYTAVAITGSLSVGAYLLNRQRIKTVCETVQCPLFEHKQMEDFQRIERAAEQGNVDAQQMVKLAAAYKNELNEAILRFNKLYLVYCDQTIE